MKPSIVLFLSMILLSFVACTTVDGDNLHRYANDIYYLCADWGPDLEAKDPEKADEIIYFVKMILFRSPWESEKGPSCRLWFCKMNWDGTHKQEICELWAGQNPSVAAEPWTMWLSVAPKAKKAAFSIEYGRTPSWGLWSIDLDGKNLHELAKPKWTDTDKSVYVHPGMSPDGEEVVFCAAQHLPGKVGQSRLGIAKVKTGEVCWLTDGPEDYHPDWSPIDDWIVYTHTTWLPNGKKPRRIWMIRPDGSEKKPVLDQAGQELFAWWPAWSTDGMYIYALSGNPWFYIIDAKTGKGIDHKSAGSEIGAAKLGRKGILCSGLALWLVPAESPLFQTTNKLYVGPRTEVPAGHYGDLSTYDLKWGEIPEKETGINKNQHK